MTNKRKIKKGRKKKEGSSTGDTIRRLQTLLDNVDSQADIYIQHMNAECDRACEKIQAVYKQKLNLIPEKERSLTMADYLKCQDKKKKLIENRKQVLGNTHSEYEKYKMMSVKKKKQHIKNTSNTTHRRSTSVPCRYPLTTIQSHGNFTPLSSKNRFLSESLLTPSVSKTSMANSRLMVTPKFNPRTPMVKSWMRKPRVDEIVMSLAGSPIQTDVADWPETNNCPQKPYLTLSLGQGKVIHINEDSDINKIDLKGIDEITKKTVQNVKNKLEQILSSGL